LEDKGPAILKLQQVNSSQTLYTFNANLQVKMYKLQSKSLKMKLVEDFRIVDDARKLLPGTIEITEQAVYINGQFFAILKKQAQKDNHTEFELSREKRVERHVASHNLCLGPFLSEDKRNLVYVYKANKAFGSSHVKTDGSEKNGQLARLMGALLRMREKCLLKPDEPVYQFVQVPLLTNNSLSLLHQDDFLRDKVELSTFTPADDILLKLRNSFLIFD